MWQPRFHDRIIRDDVEHYFVERYVELNPLVWHLDANNANSTDASAGLLNTKLKEQYGLTDFDVEYLLE